MIKNYRNAKKLNWHIISSNFIVTNSLKKSKRIISV